MLLKNGWITPRKKKKSDTMKYPTINFTGNKRKLIDWVHENEHKWDKIIQFIETIPQKQSEIRS